jgi:hypothetical protein
VVKARKKLGYPELSIFVPLLSVFLLPLDGSLVWRMTGAFMEVLRCQLLNLIPIAVQFGS